MKYRLNRLWLRYLYGFNKAIAYLASQRDEADVIANHESEAERITSKIHRLDINYG